MTDIPSLTSQARAVLAAFTENPTTDRAFDVALWAGTNLAALINALEAKRAEHAETLARLEAAYGVIEEQRIAAEREALGYVVLSNDFGHWDPVSTIRDRDSAELMLAVRRQSQPGRRYALGEVREVTE
ncbi:hypothetical protein AB0H71_13890 [Nocardia sp. NPDC050697]|uniref:hypothetical protein n=1 Tax=Nocardia sp. NPDC050697 TaxID=3155158 RepID=UPI0033F38134